MLIGRVAGRGVKLKSDEPWFCYMLRCRDGSIYVGAAKDPEKRVQRHNWGVGAKFTASRRPVVLVWFEKHLNQGAARRREAELKSWRRERKLRLIEEFQVQIHPSP